MSVRLACVDAVPTMTEQRLDALPVTIGRGTEADLQVHDTWASRVHCCLFEEAGQLFVRDLCSSNGTRINGRVIEKSVVQSGDQLTIGITTLKVSYLRLPRRSREPAVALIES